MEPIFHSLQSQPKSGPLAATPVRSFPPDATHGHCPPPSLSQVEKFIVSVMNFYAILLSSQLASPFDLCLCLNYCYVPFSLLGDMALVIFSLLFYLCRVWFPLKHYCIDMMQLRNATTSFPHMDECIFSYVTFGGCHPHKWLGRGVALWALAVRRWRTGGRGGRGCSQRTAFGLRLE